MKIPQKKQDCLNWENGKTCSDCVIKPKKNSLNCERERACKSCLGLVSQKTTYSTDINMLKRKPANECHQMLPWYLGEHKPQTATINFEAAKEVLLTAEKPMIESRRFERRNNIIACKSYIQYADIPENKEIFIYGFRHIKTDKVDNLY